MDLLCMCTICLLVFAGCADYVTANGYGGALSAYSYARPQVYDAMANCKLSLGYLS